MSNIIVAIAIGVVAVILILGLITLMRGDKAPPGLSNKLMRLRVLAQFVAIIIIMTVLYFARGH